MKWRKSGKAYRTDSYVVYSPNLGIGYRVSFRASKKYDAWVLTVYQTRMGEHHTQSARSEYYSQRVPTLAQAKKLAAGFFT
jgi:hypothetical protein